MALRTVRTNRGIDITARAITTAFQVNTTSIPRFACNQCPRGPRLPKSLSKTNPVTTGGTTRGSATSVSTMALPRHSRRASNHASRTPMGKIKHVLSRAIAAVNPMSCHSSALTSVVHAEHDVGGLDDGVGALVNFH